MEQNIEWYKDKRAILLLCWFWNEDGNAPKLLTLKEVDFDPVFNEGIEFCCSEGRWWKHCRLAQGERTIYDGKGQPVPDNIMLDVWFGKNSWPLTIKSNDVHWKSVNKQTKVRYYRVQEQPDYGDGPEFEGWAERSGETTKLVAVAVLARAVEALNKGLQANEFILENKEEVKHIHRVIAKTALGEIKQALKELTE